MTISIEPSDLTIVTATSLEYRIAREELPGVLVIEGGIALRRLERREFAGAVVSCGLAGGLRADLPTGTVLVPDSVQRPDGSLVRCDPELAGAFRKSAQDLGARYCDAPLLTSATLVRGAQRLSWANRGYAAVDMETGLLHAPRLAAVRVILDAPQNELSAAWLHPATLIFHPRAWIELPWLAREGPRCARLAARVVQQALERARD